jgi:hypothetical protein
MATTTRYLVIIVIALCVLTYIYLYTRVPNDTRTIIQVDLEQLTPALLQEKQPIVINDKIINASSLLNTVFKYSYLLSNESIIDPTPSFNQSKNKYTLLTSIFWDAMIDIADPSNTDPNNIKFISVKLNRNRVMILPALWYYRSQTPRIKRIIMDDIVSMFAYKVF